MDVVNLLGIGNYELNLKYENEVIKSQTEISIGRSALTALSQYIFIIIHKLVTVGRVFPSKNYQREFPSGSQL